MERGGTPHPDDVVPPCVDEGFEIYLDERDMGEMPPLPAKELGTMVVYFTEWGKVETLHED